MQLKRSIIRRNCWQRAFFNQKGVTLIETVISIAIMLIILISIVGALQFGQKMIVITDSKNNESAQAQELIDSILTSLSEGSVPNETVLRAKDVVAEPYEKFFYNPDIPRQYYYVEKTVSGNEIPGHGDVTGYLVKVRVYYNSGKSYVELQAFAKKYASEDVV